MEKLEKGDEFGAGSSQLVEQAKARWNAASDCYNQWPELGEDEKRELIDEERRIFERRLKEGARC